MCCRDRLLDRITENIMLVICQKNNKYFKEELISV